MGVKPLQVQVLCYPPFYGEISVMFSISLCEGEGSSENLEFHPNFFNIFYGPFVYVNRTRPFQGQKTDVSSVWTANFRHSHQAWKSAKWG